MTFVITVTGHDDLSGDEKAALENVIAGEAKALVYSLKAQHGCRLTAASVNTNTTGQVNLLAVDDDDDGA